MNRSHCCVPSVWNCIFNCWLTRLTCAAQHCSAFIVSAGLLFPPRQQRSRNQQDAPSGRFWRERGWPITLAVTEISVDSFVIFLSFLQNSTTLCYYLVISCLCKTYSSLHPLKPTPVSVSSISESAVVLPLGLQLFVLDCQPRRSINQSSLTENVLLRFMLSVRQ